MEFMNVPFFPPLLYVKVDILFGLVIVICEGFKLGICLIFMEVLCKNLKIIFIIIFIPTSDTILFYIYSDSDLKIANILLIYLYQLIFNLFEFLLLSI